MRRLSAMYSDWFVRSQTEVVLASTLLDFRSAEPDASKRISALDEQYAAAYRSYKIIEAQRNELSGKR